MLTHKFTACWLRGPHITLIIINKLINKSKSTKSNEFHRHIIILKVIEIKNYTGWNFDFDTYIKILNNNKNMIIYLIIIKSEKDRFPFEKRKFILSALQDHS